jgi:gamma-glutamylcyclotransferase (GGCT)/AIG2-like uncharacterized protein YtfP
LPDDADGPIHIDDPFQAVPTCDRALVYGTLKRGQRNHPVIQGARVLGTAVTRAGYRLYLGEIPAVDDAGDAAIEGDLVQVSAPVLARMDQLEGHPRWYRRRLVTLADGTRAWLYIHPIPNRAARRDVVADGLVRWPDGRLGDNAG